MSAEGPAELVGRDLMDLAREGLVTPPTLAALAERIERDLSGDPQFLNGSEFSTLESLCDRLRPRYPHPTGREIALELDRRLEKGERGGDGWRYASMPRDGDAYRLGLTAIEAESQHHHGISFVDLSLEDGDRLIRSMQQGRVSAPEWQALPATRFFEETLVEIVDIAYAHPAVQAAIGYVGYADAKGWIQVGLNGREDWER